MSNPRDDVVEGWVGGNVAPASSAGWQQEILQHSSIPETIEDFTLLSHSTTTKRKQIQNNLFLTS